VGGKKAKDPHSEPEKQYYVYVLEANLAFQNGMVIPLLSEVLTDLEGDQPKDKQDCEQRAFHRLAQRLKECFSHLPILALLDGLYPNGPMIELCRQNNWDFMIVLQDTSLSTVWEEIKGRQQLENKKLEKPKVWSQNWGDRRQRFQWFNDIPYVYADPATPSGRRSTSCMSSSARKAGRKSTRRAPPWCRRLPVTCGSRPSPCTRAMCTHAATWGPGTAGASKRACW
jgi:hypothetical protein